MAESLSIESELLEERLVTLETRIAYQDRLLEELNGVVAAQHRQIDDLILKLREIARQIEPLFSAPKAGEASQDDGAVEKPPHY